MASLKPHDVKHFKYFTSQVCLSRKIKENAKCLLFKCRKKSVILEVNIVTDRMFEQQALLL